MTSLLLLLWISARHLTRSATGPCSTRWLCSTFQMKFITGWSTTLVDIRSFTHYTRYGEVTSAKRAITASIVQGSGIGPASCVVSAADLQTLNPGNPMVKYADDTYLLYQPATCSRVPLNWTTSKRGPRKTICGLIVANQLKLSSQKAAVAANVVLLRRHTCPKLCE